MVEVQDQPDAAPEFVLALRSLAQVTERPEVQIQEIPAPADLAKHAVAFSCDTRPEEKHDLADRATARLVILWDETPQEAWTTRFRVIMFSKAPTDGDISAEGEASSDLVWIWLNEALSVAGAVYEAEAGTATRISSRGFGSLESQAEHHEVELRASWCPVGTELGRHMTAWQNLVCMMAGHPLHNENLGRLDIRA